MFARFSRHGASEPSWHGDRRSPGRMYVEYGVDRSYRVNMRRSVNAARAEAGRRRLAYATALVALLAVGGGCGTAVARGSSNGGTNTTAHIGDDGLHCPAGPVHIAEIQAITRQNNAGDPNLPLGEASIEICATDATKFTDVVTRGTPDGGAAGGSVGQKTGVDGTLQIRGRTAQMDATVYVPLAAADMAQCSLQDDGQQQDGAGNGTCRPHGFVASFAGTWVFSPGKWQSFQAGADSSGNPIVLAVRILNGPVE
ncbi:hypothetical protein HLH26_00645 [Gluconacetobacter sp. 1b LMG 1731]|uniref:Uncharacterized protein n=2 Tax=Gluconacetobacter TaxID=89583 RepID=A0A7W4NR44_9PROT|nr:hypothetical protein [Gluconacetobacter dulcium]MBB2163062.1 hypothetical protein [Gluconacetobacter dulcium]MBB2192243.1 hypothetical protein [Gluconacetobacter dulcium]